MPMAPCWQRPTPCPWPPPISTMRPYLSRSRWTRNIEDLRLPSARRIFSSPCTSISPWAPVIRSSTARPLRPRRRTSRLRILPSALGTPGLPATDAGSRALRPAVGLLEAFAARLAVGGGRAGQPGHEVAFIDALGEALAGEGIGAAPQLCVLGAGPHDVVVLGVPAGVGRVHGVDHSRLAGPHQHASDGLAHRGRRARVLALEARVHLAVLLRAHEEGIVEVAGADLGQQLPAGRDALGLSASWGALAKISAGTSPASRSVSLTRLTTVSLPLRSRATYISPR